MNRDESNQNFCIEFVNEIATVLIGNSKRMVNYLRRNELSPVNRDMGKFILAALEDVALSDEQLFNLEQAFTDAQEQLVAWILAILDGNVQKSGWPDDIRLINGETGENLCEEELQYVFTRMLRKLK